MRPRAGASKSAHLLLLIVAVAALGASMFAVLTISEPAAGMVLELMLVAMIVALVGAALVLESRRARSVELTTEGVSSLVWRRSGGLVPFRLEARVIPWQAVQAISQRGFAVGLKGNDGEIVVNTYLFDDPEAALAFINEQTAKASRR